MNKPSPLGSVCGEPNFCWVEPIKLSFVLSEGKEIVTQVPRHMRLIYHLPPTLFKDCCHSKASKDSVCAQHFPWTILCIISCMSYTSMFMRLCTVLYCISYISIVHSLYLKWPFHIYCPLLMNTAITPHLMVQTLWC